MYSISLFIDMGKHKKYTIDQLKEAVKNSVSIAEVIKYLGFENNSGARHKRIKTVIHKLQLDTHHFTGQAWSRGKTALDDERIGDINIIFVSNSNKSSGYIRRLIKKYCLLEYKCSSEKCFLIDEWNGQKLTLQLDHINGIRNDHRLENLRWLCPNCHSQTETFCSKNISHKKSKISDDELILAINNSKSISEALKKCNLSVGANHRRVKKLILEGRAKLLIIVKKPFIKEKVTQRKTKIVWPDVQELKKMVSENGFEPIGLKLGVSGNAVKKHLKSLGVVFPKYYTQNK